MAQQTAVEWLKQQYIECGDTLPSGVFEQAKQMDKERIMKAYNDGYRDGMSDHGDKNKDISEFDNARLYYNHLHPLHFLLQEQLDRKTKINDQV